MSDRNFRHDWQFLDWDDVRHIKRDALHRHTFHHVPAEHLQAEPDLTEAERAAVANRQKVALAFAAGVTFGMVIVAVMAKVGVWA